MLGRKNKINEERKMIYALSFVVEDGNEKLSDFFRINGMPIFFCVIK